MYEHYIIELFEFLSSLCVVFGELKTSCSKYNVDHMLGLIAGDFTGIWNSIGSENQELSTNTNTENGLGINGKWLYANISALIDVTIFFPLCSFPM